MTKPEQKNSSSQTNQSSEKLLNMLEILSNQSEPVRLQDIARLCNLNSSTALRFITALQKKNYVAQDIDTGRYYCTLKVCALAENISSSLSMRKVALPYMRNISRVFSESCNLTIDDNMQVLYVETIKGPSKMLISTQKIGHIAPLHCTGAGKLFLSEYPAVRLEHVFRVMGLKEYTGKTITEEDKLKQELALIRERGYALDNEECEDGVRCVAAPVRDHTGSIIAVLSVSGPAVRMSNELIFSNLEYLLHTTEQISLQMGWQNSSLI